MSASESAPGSLRPAEAAVRAGCGVTTISRAISAGELRALHLGHRTVLIDVDDLDEWNARRGRDRGGPDA